MIIKRCYVENFGGLSAFQYEFDSGLNVIKEKNGWGKSTLVAFIKAMLYGLTYKQNSKDFYDRKRYEPWNGGSFGGYLVFETGGKEYKVTRFFGKKNTDDTFELTDLATNRESTDFSEKLGEEIFKIDMESFERSIYVALWNDKTVEMTNDINAKLNDLIENANDIGNFDKADADLEKAIKSLERRGGSGDIDVRKEEILSIKEKIEDCDNKLKSIELMNKEVEEYLRTQKEYEAKVKAIDEQLSKIDVYSKKKQYEELKNQLKTAGQAVEELKKYFSHHVPLEKELDEYLKLSSEMSGLKAQEEALILSYEEKKTLDILQRAYENEDVTIENVNRCLKDYEEVGRLQNKINNEEVQLNILRQNLELQKTNAGGKGSRKPVVLVGLLLLVMGVADLFMSLTNVFFIWPIVGVVLILAGFMSGKKAPDNNAGYNIIMEHQNKIEEYQSMKKEIEDNYISFIREVTGAADTQNILGEIMKIKENIAEYARLKERSAKAAEAERILKEKKEQMSSFDAAFPLAEGEDMPKRIIFIRDKERDYSKAVSDMEKANRALADFEASTDINILTTVGDVYEDIDVKGLQTERERWQNEIRKTVNFISARNRDIDMAGIDADKKQEYENELERKKEEVAELRERLSILKETRKYLSKAKENLSTRYMTGMKEAFERYLKIFGVDDNIRIDADLSIKMEKNGKDRDRKFFSTGYSEMVEICTRLALVDAMYKEEQPFIILDDPFVNLDEEKLRAISSAVKELAEERQVIYCLCHESRMI